MPITSPIGFVAAYVDNTSCEIFETAPREFTVYVPTREHCECSFTLLNVASYTEATVIVKSMGLDVNWN